ADDEAVLGERVEGVAEDDRHDRHARTHRHVEGALLERAETKGGAARALRRDDERGALAERGDRGPERVDRALAVGAVDEHRAREGEGGTEERVPPHLLLRDGDDVASQELADEERVDGALVVEDEDRRPVRPQVLLAAHLEPDAGERRAELAPGGDRQVHHVAPAAVQKARDRADPEGRNDTRDRERRADDLAEARPAAAREAVDRPASPAGDRREPAARVRRPGAADDLEERQVLVAVGVEVALPELDPLLARERAPRPRL